MNHISNLSANYPKSAIRDMFRIAANYSDTVNLCNGEPNFETPDHIKEAACKALRDGMTKYATEPGLLSMREAVADKYTEQFGTHYTPENVIVTIGGVEGIFLTLAATMNPGDEVIIPDPAYTCYEGQVLTLGGTPVRVPLREEYGFQLQPEDLEKAITPKTKAVVLCYPSNPIGAVLSPEDGAKIAEIVAKHDILVISDEVYEKIIFDGRKHFSMGQIPEIRNNVLVVNSLSNRYTYSGWRIGYTVCADTEIIAHMCTMQQAVASCLPTFVMAAGTAALRGPQDCVEDMRQQYERRRDLLYNGLSEIPGLKPFRTQGSFCTFINIKDFGMTSHDFSMDLLKNAGVMTIAGSAFGSMGEGFLRICFANSDENIKEGIRRMKEYLTSDRFHGGKG